MLLVGMAPASIAVNVLQEASARPHEQTLRGQMERNLA